MCENTVSIFLPKYFFFMPYYCTQSTVELTFISNKFLTFLHPELRKKRVDSKQTEKKIT